MAWSSGAKPSCGARAPGSTRTRLAALLDELNELNLTEARARTGVVDSPPQGAERDLAGSLTFRRALIAEQASSLERMIGGHDVVAEEYSTLAAAFESVGDLDRALQLWQQAVDRATNRSVMTQVACLRSLAGCRYLRGDVDGAREAVEGALVILPEHDRGRLDYVETCLELAALERQLAPDGGGERQALERARSAQAEIREPGMKRYAAQVVAAYQKDESDSRHSGRRGTICSCQEGETRAQSLCAMTLLCDDALTLQSRATPRRWASDDCFGSWLLRRPR